MGLSTNNRIIVEAIRKADMVSLSFGDTTLNCRGGASTPPSWFCGTT